MSEENTTPVAEMQTFENVDFSINEAQMKTAKAVNVTPSYLEMKKGETVFCKFVKFTQITINDKQTGEVKTHKAAILATSKGFVINSGVNLVNQLERSNFAAGTPLKIELTDIVKQTKIYTVFILTN